MGSDTTVSSNFKVFSRVTLDELVNRRPGETKIGQRVAIASHAEDIALSLIESEARFVLLGIPEDIGVRANGGIGGAHTAWVPALKALLNMQSVPAFTGTELLVLGAFDFADWMESSLSESLDDLRKRVSRIDEAVAPIIRLVVAAGKIPLVIGGGHNNSFPLLKGVAMARGGAANCINLDAHSDYRIAEGRHSGNGFRYAKDAGYLSRYAMIGLHEAYNSAPVIADIGKDADLHFSFFEDIFLRERTPFMAAIENALLHTAGSPTGIELDLDCIAGVLSSAATPVGLTVLQARRYLARCAQHANVAYLHLTEGATQLRDGRTDGSTAKLIAYLASDFIKAMLARQ